MENKNALCRFGARALCAGLFTRKMFALYLFLFVLEQIKGPRAASARNSINAFRLKNIWPVRRKLIERRPDRKLHETHTTLCLVGDEKTD
jgi:hypothetical protein